MTAGSFEITKKDGPTPSYKITCTRKATADISIENENYTGKYRGNYIFKGEITAKNDLLASPVKWECETKISDDKNGLPYLNTLHQWKGSFKNGQVILSFRFTTYCKNTCKPGILPGNGELLTWFRKWQNSLFMKFTFLLSMKWT